MSKYALISDQHHGIRNDASVFYDYQKNFYDTVFFPTLEKENIDTVINLGDLFDRRKFVNYLTLQRLKNDFLNPLYERGIKMYLILGNHDTFYKDTNEVNSPQLLLQEYDNIEIIENEPKEIDNFALIPWINKSNSENIFTYIQNTDVKSLLGHFDIAGFTMTGNYTSKEGIDSVIFSKFDCVLSGHFHTPQQKENIWYLGSPFQFNYGDYGEKRGFYIWDLYKHTYNFYENPVQLFQKIFYDDVKHDMLSIEYSQYANVYVKVIVIEKNNQYNYDKFMNKLQNVNPIDISVVEDHRNVCDINEDELKENVKTTKDIIQESVDELQYEEKESVKEMLFQIFQEAQFMEE